MIRASGEKFMREVPERQLKPVPVAVETNSVL
jgi:hypothetical protein